jgi:hypothetical protein
MAINPVNRDSNGEEFRNRLAKRVVREYGSAFLDIVDFIINELL